VRLYQNIKKLSFEKLHEFGGQASSLPGYHRSHSIGKVFPEELPATHYKRKGRISYEVMTSVKYQKTSSAEMESTKHDQMILLSMRDTGRFFKKRQRRHSCIGITAGYLSDDISGRSPRNLFYSDHLPPRGLHYFLSYDFVFSIITAFY